MQAHKQTLNPNAAVIFIPQTLGMDVSGKKGMRHKKAEGGKQTRWEEGQKEGGKWVGGKKGSK